MSKEVDESTMAAPLDIIQKRNIIILGRTGTGKKTIANQIVNRDALAIDSHMASLTREAGDFRCDEVDPKRKVHYNINILDTLGPYSSTISTSKIVNYIMEYPSREGREGVNLVLFTFRKGVYEDNECKIFKKIIENRIGEEIRNISALVITGCETLDEEERTRLINELKEDDSTKTIAEFMGKGIFPVGFPLLQDVKETLKEECKKGIASDTEGLRELADNSEGMSYPQHLPRNTTSRCKLFST